jgi:ribose transport system substrate-binding protein
MSQPHRIVRFRVLGIALLLLTIFAGAGPGFARDVSGTNNNGKVYKIALSMSYTGNTWQVEARNMVLAEAKTPPYDKRVKLSVFVAGPNAGKQISQMQQIIAQGFNAIITFPISPTVLNPVVTQACEHGLVVVAYDAEVTARCAYNVHINQTYAGVATAQWLVKSLNGRGNIILSTGVTGTSVDAERTSGAESVFARYPDIHIVDSYSGMWDQAIAQRGMARELSLHHNIDGVWAQVGYGIVQAFKAAHRKMVPITGESENGYRNELYDGTIKGISYGSPPYTGAYAFKMAVAILDGAKLPHFVQVPLPLNTRSQLKRCTDVALGCNVIPLNKASADYVDDFYDKNLVPELCYQATRTGNPCRGKTARLPATWSWPPTATSRA